MMTNERAYYIAYQWMNAWNNRDIEKVLGNYDKNIRYTCPWAAMFGNKKSSTIRGKKMLRDYFLKKMKTFRHNPVEIQEIMLGVNSLTIVYRASEEKIAMETMFLNNNGKIYRSYVFYN